MNPMRALALLVLCLLGLGFPALARDDVDAERAQLREQSEKVLEELYAARPEARRAVADAAGVATFRNLGMKLGVAGGGKGRGLARDHAGAETFMRFVEVQAGVGVGIKRYDLVFVFEDAATFREFLTKGWQPSGQTTLAAKGKKGGISYQGAVAVAPGVWLYQLTGKGLAAELTVKGSKYFPDKDLN